jgi:hypothetical protein
MEAKAKPYVQSQQRQVSGSHTTNRNKGIKAVRVSHGHARDSSNKARGTEVQGIDGGMQTCCLSASVVEKRKEKPEGGKCLG